VVWWDRQLGSERHGSHSTLTLRPFDFCLAASSPSAPVSCRLQSLFFQHLQHTLHYFRHHTGQVMDIFKAEGKGVSLFPKPYFV